jgi:hypothetical protein
MPFQLGSLHEVHAITALVRQERGQECSTIASVGLEATSVLVEPLSDNGGIVPLPTPGFKIFFDALQKIANIGERERHPVSCA